LVLPAVLATSPPAAADVLALYGGVYAIPSLILTLAQRAQMIGFFFPEKGGKRNL
jgi:drug/metabolite transporter superfamily protein YnfA